MKKIILFFAFACFICFNGFSQNCASSFAVGTISYTELCLSGAAGPYTITILAASDSALTFSGLYEVPGSYITADIDCNTHTFTIPRQTISSNLQIQGYGILNYPVVNVYYYIYLDSITTTVNDSCMGTYGAAIGTGGDAEPQSLCTLSPNPTQQTTLLQISGLATPGTTWTYRVLDLQGRDAAVGALDASMQAMIETQHMATGMYHVMAQSSDGQLVSKVLVVE